MAFHLLKTKKSVGCAKPAAAGGNDRPREQRSQKAGGSSPSPQRPLSGGRLLAMESRPTCGTFLPHAYNAQLPRLLVLVVRAVWRGAGAYLIYR